MTNLTQRTTRLRFQTADTVLSQGKYRQVCVEARPEYAIVCLSGLRTKFTVPWGGVFSLAAKMAVAAAEKAEKKRGKK